MLCCRLILAGVLVSNVAFVLAAVALYRLGCAVLNDEPLACTAALLFVINPASVFFSAIYTESVFALTSFAGMLFGMLGSRNTLLRLAFLPLGILPSDCNWSQAGPMGQLFL
jgi:phosphatidylinositol glycan class V